MLRVVGELDVTIVQTQTKGPEKNRQTGAHNNMQHE